jgi:hypothetical protein
MKKLKYLLYSLIFLVSACETMEDPETKHSSAYPVSGEWIVNLGDGTDVYAGPYRLKTYNTSFSKDSIWLDDHDNSGLSVGMKGKAALNIKANTFASNLEIPVDAFEDTLILVEGKVINKDSIFIRVQFKSEPGTDYQIAGHRLLGYDEYQNPW